MDLGCCPICCEEFKSFHELEFVPCPCGFQPCKLCFERMAEWPHCRMKYDEKNFRTIQFHFFYLTEQEMLKQRIICRNNLIIRSLPEQLLNLETLKSYNFLGQYGKIDSISINNKQVYVTFCSEKAAQNCAEALN